MYMETLFHELSHSLGPGSITVNGRKTTVDEELKDVGSGFEEAKADVMGAYNVLFMMDKGVLPAAEKPQIRAAYVAGLFRAMRFGDTDAHGRGAAMQYRYLRDKGGIVWDANAKRFRIDPAKLDAGIRDLVGDIVRLQATGDYNGTKAFLAKWAVMDAEAKQVTATMGHIPVDIRPIYPEPHVMARQVRNLRRAARAGRPGRALQYLGRRQRAGGGRRRAPRRWPPAAIRSPTPTAGPTGSRCRSTSRFANAKRIVDAVELPLTVDFEGAYSADPGAGRRRMSRGSRRPARSAAISRTR